MESPKPTRLVKLKSQTIYEKLNLTIDDPIVCLQENQLFSIFGFQIKFEISELFRHWGFKSQMFFIKSLPTKFFRFRIPLSVDIYHRWNFSDLHVFFLFFFCFSDGENRMIFTLLVVFITLVLKWCSTWGIERFVNLKTPSIFKSSTEHK